MKRLKLIKFIRAVIPAMLLITSCIVATAVSGLMGNGTANYGINAATDGENATEAAVTHSSPRPTYATPYSSAYSFEFEAFKVTYDVRTDRTMDVTMDLTVHYTGFASTGIIHDIPVNAGDRVRKIRAYELFEDGDGGVREGYLAYTVDHDLQNFVSVNMGDTSNKTNETHTYRIYYEYAITKPVAKNVLYLNAVGYGSDGGIKSGSVTYNLPDGVQSVKYYVGDSDTAYPLTPENGTVSIPISLNPHTGITFEIEFADGVLSTRPDLTPYYIIIGACVLLGALFALKFLVFNKDGLTPIVNVEAPDKMNPLVMGKLIDNKVDQSDVTSLIYYWADKGYLKINLDNPNNVELIRMVRSLPPSSPNHEHVMFNNLFMRGDMVRVNSIAYSFYPTVDTVTKEVNGKTGNLYEKKSMVFAVLFAVIGGLLMGATPGVLPLFTINLRFSYPAPLLMLVPTAVVFLIALNVRYLRLKYDRKKIALSYLLAAGISLVCSVVYAFFVPSYVIEVVPKLLLCAVGFTMVILSTLLVNRTESYVEKLNHIVGFREFIQTAEKEKLEMMLEGNPELYYHVLPYAIVLGVSDIWADKFKSISIAPPSWTTTQYYGPSFNVLAFHHTVNLMTMDLTSKMVSRPSSDSLSGGGGHHGGGIGGHGGGGHGGGGFRGR